MSTLLATIRGDINNLKKYVEGLINHLKTTRPSPGTKFEVEIRFRSYTEKLGISFRQFHLIQKYLGRFGLKPIITTTVDQSQPHDRYKYASIRRTEDEENGNINWSIKRPIITPIDNYNFNIRYAISQEIPINQVLSLKPETKRRKERYSYAYGNDYRVDLTKVNNGESFELELELKEESWNLEEAYGKNLYTVITQLLCALHDTEYIYPVRLYRSIVEFFHTTMHVNPIRGRPGTINHKMLFQARNLNARDMVTGGLTGNPTSEYNVTIKADGERKLLIIHSTGVWLLMGPDQANWLYPFQEGILQKITTHTHRDPTGTIFEGELVPIDKRKAKAPNTKYWFLIFDCLARSTNNLDVGDSSVQNLTHTNRLLVARQAKPSLDLLGTVKLNNGQSLLTASIKDFFGFNSATTLFELIRKLELRKSINYYAYEDDGYIFTANNMPYNYKADYSGYQNVSVYWIKTNDNTWRNNQGSIMYRRNNTLIEQTPGSQLHKMISIDAEWYSSQSLKWILQPNKNVWVAQNGRQWITTNPLTASSQSRRGARKAREESDTIQEINGDLWQTIKIFERGHKPISKMPLHMRKLTRFPDICKWKPPNQLTIDFATIRHGNHLQLMVSGFDRSLVPFTGTPHHPFITNPNSQPYGPVDHNNEKTLNIVDKVTIVEYAWNYDSKNPMMIPIKIRHDKTRPNQMDIANAVWSDIQDPIDIQTMQGNTFRFMRKYHNRIKWKLFSQLFKDVDREYTLLDIGSGIGGDSLKMLKARRIVMVEPNDSHLKELQQRLRSIFHQTITQIILPSDNQEQVKQKTDKAIQDGHRVVIVKTIGEDNDTISRVVNIWLGGPAQRLSMMLSLSFFWESSEHLDRLAKTILTNLDPAGRGIFLTIDGRTVHHAFHPIRLTSYSESNISSSSNISSLSNTSSSPKLLESESRSDINTLGGQRSDYDTSKFGTATLKYNATDDSLLINIPDSIVTNQQEWLVYLDELASRLSSRFQLDSTIRADQESFMSGAEYRLSSMYTGGHIYPKGTSLNIPLETSRSIKQHSGAKQQGIYKSIESPIQTIKSRSTIQQNRSVSKLTTKLGKISISGTHVDKITTTIKPSGSVIVTSPSKISGNRPTSIIQPIIQIKPVSTELPMLPIRYDHLTDTGIGDDVVQTLNISWYKEHPVVRIATIADGSCFFHGVLKAFYEPYANTKNYTTRKTIVQRLRRDLAVSLNQNDPRAKVVQGEKPKTYYQTANNGQWVDLSVQQSIGLTLEFDPRLEGMETFINSMRDIGSELYNYISDMLEIDIYVMHVTTKDLTLIFRSELSATTSNTSTSSKDHFIVVIAGNGRHYETVGIDMGTKGIQTMFKHSHPFIKAAILGQQRYR